MATINNKYDIGSKVFFVENTQIKTGEITSIVYRGNNFFDYIIDEGCVGYNEKLLSTTPEKALKSYIEKEKNKTIRDIEEKYKDLENDIFENWAKSIR
jgi:predicted DNA-binding transcriptional regulator